MIVADVYPAGEAPIEGVNRDALVQGLRRMAIATSWRSTAPTSWPALIAGMAQPGDFVVCLGAG